MLKCDQFRSNFLKCNINYFSYKEYLNLKQTLCHSINEHLHLYSFADHIFNSFEMHCYGKCATICGMTLTGGICIKIIVIFSYIFFWKFVLEQIYNNDMICMRKIYLIHACVVTCVFKVDLIFKCDQSV